MKLLIIGGSGLLSYSLAEISAKNGYEVYALNRRGLSAPNVNILKADINDKIKVKELISPHFFDAVIDFISFTPDDINRAYNLFSDRCRQYIFISSASVYENSEVSSVITEKTLLANPFASYSRNKIGCEERLKELKNFCYTIVRPSHTYNDFCLPVGVCGEKGFFEVYYRIKNELPVIIHGDGTTFWTITHAEDLANGILSLIGNEQSFFNDFTITSDDYISWNGIYRLIAGAINKRLNPLYVSAELLCKLSRLDYKASLVGDKSNNKVFDCSKLKKISPDFKCKIKFEDRVDRIIQNIEKDESIQVRDHNFASFCDKIDEQYKLFISNFKEE